MKYINCPLCGKKQAISQSDYKKITTVHPIAKTFCEPHLGNYTMGYIGGEYDYSHAEDCPKLEKVFFKQDLLRYHIQGIGTNPIKSDLFSFDDYQKLFKESGVNIEVEINRVNVGIEVGWLYSISLRSTTVGSRQDMKTNGDSPDRAFQLLRHRLLCGELIHVVDTLWQLCIKGKELRLNLV